MYCNSCFLLYICYDRPNLKKKHSILSPFPDDWKTMFGNHSLPEMQFNKKEIGKSDTYIFIVNLVLVL